MKQYIALVLAFVCMVCLVGCGSKVNKKQTDNAQINYTMLCGMKTGISYGYIEYTSAYVTYSGHSLGDTVWYDIYTEQGDSGGPVGLLAPIAKAKFYLMCIHAAGSSIPGISMGVGVKVSNIVALSSLDITPVTSLNP